MPPTPSTNQGPESPEMRELPPISVAPETVKAGRAALQEAFVNLDKADVDEVFEKIISEEAKREEWIASAKEFIATMSTEDINMLALRIGEEKGSQTLQGLGAELFGDLGTIKDTAGSRALEVDAEGKVVEKSETV